MKLKGVSQKRGQVGGTITWIVATVIIIVILIFSIFVASLLSKSKKIGREIEEAKSRDLLVTKSLMGYLSTLDNSGKIIFEQLKEGEVNDFNKNLALKIFEGFYLTEYSFSRWLGIVRGSSKIEIFGIRPLIGAKTGAGYKTLPAISEVIFLDENKFLELIFVRGK